VSDGGYLGFIALRDAYGNAIKSDPTTKTVTYGVELTSSLKMNSVPADTDYHGGNP
jgi:hypothetical protein